MLGAPWPFPMQRRAGLSRIALSGHCVKGLPLRVAASACLQCSHAPACLTCSAPLDPLGTGGVAVRGTGGRAVAAGPRACRCGCAGAAVRHGQHGWRYAMGTQPCSPIAGRWGRYRRAWPGLPVVPAGAGTTTAQHLPACATGAASGAGSCLAERALGVPRGRCLAGPGPACRLQILLKYELLQLAVIA